MNLRTLLCPLIRKALEQEKKYTKAEIDELVSRFYGLIRAKVRGKYIYIPDQSKPLAEARDTKIARAYKNGVSVLNIMSMYGLSRAAVYKILRKQSVIFQPKK